MSSRDWGPRGPQGGSERPNKKERRKKGRKKKNRLKERNKERIFLGRALCGAKKGLKRGLEAKSKERKDKINGFPRWARRGTWTGPTGSSGPF
jgi:hypothetical protein